MHVGLYLPNTPHYTIAFFSVLKAGGTVVNYSPLDAAAVREHKIEDSRTNFLIRLDLAAHYPQMETMVGKTRCLRAGSILASRSLRSHLISDVDRPQERLIVICKDECASRVAITRGLVVRS